MQRNMTDDSAKPIKTADSDRPKPIGIDPAAYDGDIVSRLRHWRGLHLAHNGELFEAAADEIERLRTIMYRVVDEDCTVAIQGGTFYADDEPLFAISDTKMPRNGAVRGPDPDSRVWETYGHTPETQPTPGEGSKQGECITTPATTPAWMQRPFWVDPPSGWRYGFPKRYDPATGGDMTAWMIANGYPERLAKQRLHCTFTACEDDQCPPSP